MISGPPLKLTVGTSDEPAWTSTPAPENGTYYPALDGLRGVSMLMIFQVHYLGALLNWGWAGVDFFFVLSSFLITGILYDTRHTAHRFRNFYGRAVSLYTVPSIYLGADLLYRTTMFRLEALLLGGMLALMLRGPEAVRLLRFRRPMLLLIICGFTVFQIAYRIVAGHSYSALLNSPGVSTFGFTAVDLLAGAVLLMALDSGSWVYRLLMLKPLRRFGKVSYGFYVLHEIPQALYYTCVRRFYEHFGLRHGQQYAFAALGFAATLALSVLSFRFVEQPFLRMKTRFLPRQGVQQRSFELPT